MKLNEEEDNMVCEMSTVGVKLNKGTVEEFVNYRVIDVMKYYSSNNKLTKKLETMNEDEKNQIFKNWKESEIVLQDVLQLCKDIITDFNEKSNGI